MSSLTFHRSSRSVRALATSLAIVIAIAPLGACHSSGSPGKQPSIVVASAIPGASSGTIVGTVTYEGVPLPGATITITSPAMTGKRIAVSNENGDYGFLALPPGQYTIAFEMEGMSTVVRTASVSAGEKLRVPAVVSLSGVAEAITVTAASPTALETTEIRANLPDNGRNRPIQKRPKTQAPPAAPTVTAQSPAVLQTTEVRTNFTSEMIEQLPVARMVTGAPAPVGGLTVELPPTSEKYASVEEGAFRRASEEPISTFSIDTDRASYANARRYIQFGSLPPVDAVRVEEMINYFDYSYPEPSDGRPFSITTEIADCPWNASNKILRVGVKGRTVAKEAMPPGNFVFLVDVSGSMSTPDKLPLVKESLKKLAAQLRPDDRVAIVVYASAEGLVLESTSGRDMWRIVQAIEGLGAGGSTAGGAGIMLAYKIAADNYIRGGNNRVILATDGDFNVGLTSIEALQQLIEAKREEGVFLSVLGVGTGNLNDHLMETMADKGNGQYSYLDSLEEAEKVLVREMAGTLYTIAKDVKIQVEFNPMRVGAYRLVGYDNRTLAREDFEDDTKDAGELGAGHTVTALYELVPPGGERDAVGDREAEEEVPADERASMEDEAVVHVRLRYKEPDATVSALLEDVVLDSNKSYWAASEDFRFVAAVAQFGLLLRESQYKGESSWKSVIDLARSAASLDTTGDRAAFIALAEQAQELDARKVATR